MKRAKNSVYGPKIPDFVGNIFDELGRSLHHYKNNFADFITIVLINFDGCPTSVKGSYGLLFARTIAPVS